MQTQRKAPRLNRYLFSQIGLDSSALTTLGTIIHRVGEPGVYGGSVLRGRQTVGQFYLRVDPDCTATQVNIDLSKLKPLPDGCEPGKAVNYIVGTMGYIVFHVSSGPGGYAVLLGTTGREPHLAFDSRELKDGDIFSAVILRPGQYVVANAGGRAKGEINVAYPVIGRERYRPGDPVTVECTPRGFSPPAAKVGAAQPVVFQVKGTARLKIELVKADDGPGRSP